MEEKSPRRGTSSSADVVLSHNGAYRGWKGASSAGFCSTLVGFRITAPEETTFHLLHLSLMREYVDYEFSVLRVRTRPSFYAAIESNPGKS